MNYVFTVLIAILLIPVIAYLDRPPFPLSILAVAAFVLPELAARLVHRKWFATLLKQDGFSLVKFGASQGFVSWHTTPHWWQWRHVYSGTVVNDSGDCVGCTLAISGPIWALIHPVMHYHLDQPGTNDAWIEVWFPDDVLLEGEIGWSTLTNLNDRMSAAGYGHMSGMSACGDKWVATYAFNAEADSDRACQVVIDTLKDSKYRDSAIVVHAGFVNRDGDASRSKSVVWPRDYGGEPPNLPLRSRP